jgi:hypothetical protein
VDRVTRVATTSPDPAEAAIAYNTGQYNLIMQPGGFALWDRHRNAWAP